MAQHQIFERVIHRVSHRLHVSVIGEHQRQFLFIHQRAGWNRGQDRITFLRKFRQVRDIGFFETGDGFEIAKLEFGHSTAGFLLDQPCRDFVVRKYGEQVVADTWLVVIDVTGGIDRHLPRCALAILHCETFIDRCIFAERLAVVFGQLTILVDAKHTVHDLARNSSVVHSVYRLCDHRYRGQLAQCVGAG